MLARLPAFALTLALLGCGAAGDPYIRAGTWRATGANDRNLELMVQNPADLTAGRGTRYSFGPEASPPITRLLTDSRKPLPDVRTSRVSATGATPAAGAPAAPGGAIEQ